MASANLESKLLGNTLYSFDNPQTIFSEQNPDWKFDFECGFEEMMNIQNSYRAGIFRTLCDDRDYETEIFHNRYAAYYNTCTTRFSNKDSLLDAYEDHDKAASQVVRDMLVEGKSLEYCMDMVMNCSPIAISRQELCEDYALRIVQKGRQMAEEKSLEKSHHMENQR